MDGKPSVQANQELHVAPAHPDRAVRSVFRNRSFVALWLGQFIANLGNSVYQLALLWEMKVLTGSTVMMSTVSIASLLPLIVVGPFVGVLADRWPKRISMMASDIVRAAVIAVLTVMLSAHLLAPWMLIAGAFLNGLVGSLYQPSNAALVPMLVGKENLQQANSVTQGSTVVAQIIGPFVGGILVAHVSMTAAFAVNAVSYVASVVSLLFVAHREPVRQLKKLDGKQFVAELREGLVFIGSMPLMRTLIPVALVANFLLAPFELVLIQYCTTVLHGDAQLFGALGACWSGGMLIGAVAAGVLAKKIRKGILISVCFPVFTLVLLAMACTTVTWLALSLAALGGLFNMVVNILVVTIIQAAVPQDKMGRVFGSFTLLLQGAQPFAQALAGYLLTVFSVPVLMAMLAILTTIDAFVAAASKVVRSQE